MSNPSGFLVIDKPAGITSHDVVAKIRKRFATKRVGHAGTLDPMATGVLVLGVGIATKLLQFIVAGIKRYEATIRLGVKTTTDDQEGEIVSQVDANHLSDQEIKSALTKFVGLIQQVPSSVSAIKVDGKRAYDLVREGATVELAARPVEISELKIVKIHRTEFVEIDIEVTCSAGTYIRAIARDLGDALGVGGHLVSLRRTLVAPFAIESADGIEDAPLLPLVEVISEVLPIRELSEVEVSELRFGRKITTTGRAGTIAAIHDNKLVALITDDANGAKPVSVFNP
jgi:tRNA pseudouridine55 synthase